jgi:hypothetical protein
VGAARDVMRGRDVTARRGEKSVIELGAAT